MKNKKTDSTKSIKKTVKDGWQNLLTGLGKIGSDKRMDHTFCPDFIDYDTCINIWRGDDIAARAIELPADDMTRAGFDMLLSTDGAEKEIQDRVESEWSKLGLQSALKKALELERAVGGSAILIGVRDYKDLSEPISESGRHPIDFLTVLDVSELTPTHYYADIRKPNYGKPALYSFSPISVGNPIDKTDHTAITIHESRLCVFEGIRVSKQDLNGRTGWGDPITTRLWSTLRDFNIAWDGTGVMVSDFGQPVFKMKNLSDLLGTVKGEENLRKRLQAMSISMSTVRALVMDSEDHYERQATPLGGLADILREYFIRMASAADMPVALLFEKLTSGLGVNNEGDIRMWYDKITSKQEIKVVPQIRKITDILMRYLNVSGDYTISPRPLWQPTEKEIVETRKIQAEIDQIYMNLAIVSGEDITTSRFGGDRYSIETSVDFDAILEIEGLTAEATAEGPPGDKTPGEEDSK